jgi:hypothetical protein
MLENFEKKSKIFFLRLVEILGGFIIWTKGEWATLDIHIFLF